MPPLPHDTQVRMEWLSSRGLAHLFLDADGALREHSALRDGRGTLQLEELIADEAERRYGSASAWGSAPRARPSLATTATSIVQTLRDACGRRPPRTSGRGGSA